MRTRNQDGDPVDIAENGSMPPQNGKFDSRKIGNGEGDGNRYGIARRSVRASESKTSIGGRQVKPISPQRRGALNKKLATLKAALDAVVANMLTDERLARLPDELKAEVEAGAKAMVGAIVEAERKAAEAAPKNPTKDEMDRKITELQAEVRARLDLEFEAVKRKTISIEKLRIISNAIEKAIRIILNLDEVTLKKLEEEWGEDLAAQNAISEGTSKVVSEGTQANEEGNKNTIKLMENALASILDFLNDHQQTISVIDFVAGTLCPMLGITRIVIEIICRMLAAINTIIFVRNNYPAISEWAKEHPYLSVAALTAVVAAAPFFLVRGWTRKAPDTKSIPDTDAANT
jgi:hypothetical protein